MKVVSKPTVLLDTYKLLTLFSVFGIIFINAVSVFVLKVPGALEVMPTFDSWFWKQVEFCVVLPLAFGAFFILTFAVCRIASWDLSESGVEAKLAGFVWYRYGWYDIQCVGFTKASVILMTRRGRMRYLPFVGKDDVRDLVPLEKQRDFTGS